MPFPCPGDALVSPCACAPSGWEEYHQYTWSEYRDYEGRIHWAVYSWETVPPLDRLITASNVRTVLDQVFFDYIQEGAPLRMCFMNKADRRFGIPYVWHYQLYIEYHESPLITAAAVLEAFLAIALIVIGVTLTMRLGGEGFVEKIGDSIIVPAVSGIALIFILGIGFIVALSYFAPGVRATARPPQVPGAGLVPVSEVSVGPAAVARRRGR